MELVVLAERGSLPEHPADLFRAYFEAEWIEERRAKVLARELALVLGKMFGK